MYWGSRTAVGKIMSRPGGGGGGGGTQIWFRRGCAAEAAKPVAYHLLAEKGYPLLGVFIQENDVLCTLATKLGVWRKRVPILGVFIQENEVFVYFSDEMGENNYLVSTVKLQKWGACLGIFRHKTIPHV